MSNIVSDNPEFADLQERVEKLEQAANKGETPSCSIYHKQRKTATGDYPALCPAPKKCKGCVFCADNCWYYGVCKNHSAYEPKEVEKKYYCPCGAELEIYPSVARACCSMVKSKDIHIVTGYYDSQADLIAELEKLPARAVAAGEPQRKEQ